MPNIEVVPNTEVKVLHGEHMLEAITLRNRLTGEERVIETGYLFLCLGGVPNTEWAAEVGIVRDEEGYLVTGPDLRRYGCRIGESWKVNREPYYLETSMPGVFAAGDVRHGSVKRLTSAVGEGAMAIAFVHRYLASG
jgi:thioredoxin reductase (NADPH)